MFNPARRGGRSSYVLLVAVMATVAMLVTPIPDAEASHFRATQVTWHTTGTPDQVEFHLSGSFRCTFYFSDPCSATPGDTFFEYSMDYGDGAFETPQWTVVSVDVANDVVNAESHLVHQYASAGVYDAVLSGCCRLSSFDGHVNNPDGSLAVSTLVDLTAGRTASPESQISPIVDCPIDAVCQFSVPATDPDGDTLQWRFPDSTDPESNGGTFAQPPGATIGATTGLYTFDTTGVPLAASGDTFYSTNVIIEALQGSVVVGQIAVDFFIRIGDTTNQAPVFEPPTPADGTTINATVGTPVTFDTQASDPDAGDTVTLGMLGKPAAATYTTTTGNPATGTFSWTPTATGTTLLTLTATDQQGRQATQRSVTIVVGAGTGNTSPTAEANGPYAADEGSAVAISGTASDVDGDPLTTTWTATPGADVDAGASCTFADAAALSTTVACDDDGTWTLTLTADDGTATGSDTATLTVGNVAPTVSITSPTDGSSSAAGSPLAVSASFGDAGANDTHTCEVDFGDGTVVAGTVGSGTCDASHTYPTFGLYTITVTVTDDDGGIGTATVTITVVAPGTITGGGWTRDATGQPIHAGFVAGFDEDTGAPRGQLQVQFHDASGARHRFHGDTVDVLAMGDTFAEWSGSGRFDGVDGATYEIRAEDNGKPGKGRNAGSPDALRLTIRDAGGNVVYDLPLTAWSQGNITRHH